MKDFDKEITTVWSFPKRGKWSTHNPNYRGNFAPQLARNVILRYSKSGEIILDPMVGSGTTLIETSLLSRRGIGLDINPEAIQIAKKNLKSQKKFKYEQIIETGNAKKLDGIEDNSIDLILTHPPYLNIISYSDGKIKNDLSNISDVNNYIIEFNKVVKQFYRVLKDNSICAILIGDTRKNKHYIPLSNYIMTQFLQNNFVLKEDIIKIQHNCHSTSYWRKKVNKYNFLLIKHEHLYIFRKPAQNEKLNKIKYSTGLAES